MCPNVSEPASPHSGASGMAPMPAPSRTIRVTRLKNFSIRPIGLMEKFFNRVTLIVLDGAGIGAMPDAPEWGDAGSDTFGHICESRQLNLPNLQGLGLGNIRPLAGVPAIANPRGSYGKCALKSNGKDTTTGHWEMAGIILERAFPTYPNGFPQ